MNSIKVCAPSRIYGAHTRGSFSTTAMIDYMSEIGFDGIDMSFDGLSATDQTYKSILYAAKNRATAKDIELASCHLPFYMPDPHDESAMARYSRDVMAGIDAAAMMRIPLGVIHPIALHERRDSAEFWAQMNINFLTPLCEHAYKSGVKLCIENMASTCEDGKDHLFGSAAGEILALSQVLGTGVCWDLGHANISGRPIDDMLCLEGRLSLIHAHDNDGYRDTHKIPFDGTIDWERAAECISHIGYRGYISIEARAWDISPDDNTRRDFGRRVLYAGRRIAKLSEQGKAR